MSYTLEQVREAIDYFDDSTELVFFDEIMWCSAKPIFLPLLGESAVFVEREGGTEGDGDYMHVVFQIGDQFFMKEGYHNSWDSDEWDGDFTEVKPVEVTVTKYVSV